MMRNLVLMLLVAAAIGFAAWRLWDWHGPEIRGGHDTHGGHDGQGYADHGEGDLPKGPHGGKLFSQEGFAVEVTIVEAGIPPEFRVYAYHDGKRLSPQAVDVEIKLTRLDGQVDRFTFSPVHDYLRGSGVVAEPHSFDIVISAVRDGRRYQWQAASYEGRTQIPAAMAEQAGIRTEQAGPVSIAEVLTLTGRVQTVPDRLAQVRARFPGVVQRVAAKLGDAVKAGATLAQIQSNESLQSYAVKAPIDGVILARDVQIGATTGDTPLFVIADLSQVWVELDVFGGDISRVRAGQTVAVETLDGAVVQGVIDWVSPLALHASQSVQARIVVDNRSGRLRPGQFVRGEVTVAEHAAALAVRQSAIQRFRDFEVVFARIGDTYEVRMLELGRRNRDWVEVTGGLKPGTVYVTQNSYLVKADIEKSGASHDH